MLFYIFAIYYTSKGTILLIFTFHNFKKNNIYVYLYLKLTDPGPKGQGGWDFEYKSNDYNTILNKINNPLLGPLIHP